MDYSTADLLEDPSISIPKPRNVSVVVSGSTFSMNPSLYGKVQKLPWVYNANERTVELSTNPDLFEMLLQYFLFDSLPDCKALDRRKANDLLSLIAPLGDQDALQPLVNHIKKIIKGFKKEKKTRRASMSSSSSASSSLLQRGFVPLVWKMKKKTPSKRLITKKNTAESSVVVPAQETTYSFAARKTNAVPDVDYLPNLIVADSMDSDETTLTGTMTTSGNASLAEQQTSSKYVASNIRKASSFDCASYMEETSSVSTKQPTTEPRRRLSQDSGTTTEPTTEPRRQSQEKKKSDRRRSSMLPKTKDWKSGLKSKLSGRSSRTLTHAEWCATEFVL